MRVEQIRTVTGVEQMMSVTGVEQIMTVTGVVGGVMCAECRWC